MSDALPAPVIVELEEEPQQFIVTITMIVHCRPKLLDSAQQLACEATARCFTGTGIMPLRVSANSFRYQPDPRNLPRHG